MKLIQRTKKISYFKTCSSLVKIIQVIFNSIFFLTKQREITLENHKSKTRFSMEPITTSGTPVFNPGFQLGSCYLIFMCNVLQIVVCPFVLFLLAIVLSVLQIMDSNYPFVVFKLFLQVYFIYKYISQFLSFRWVVFHVYLHPVLLIPYTDFNGCNFNLDFYFFFFLLSIVIYPFHTRYDGLLTCKR